MFKFLAILMAVASPLVVMGQQPGTMTQEVHPKLTWEHCQKGGHCSQVHGGIVLDASWRWVHDGKGKNCLDGNQWNAEACPDDATCAKNCVVEGIQDYQKNSGVSTSGSTLRMNYLTNGNVGSRLYLMANETNYQMFKLLNQELTFDVDMSMMECGMNAALYLVSMESDGGSHKYPNNKAGAKYGTGYCDAQCPNGFQFIAGARNPEGANKLGACCAEMDIWEGNKMATVYTPHPCKTSVYNLCKGDVCVGGTPPDRYNGPCDNDGCGFNSYQNGNHSYYGPGQVVDTNKPITVVTQFVTNDGTDHGHLTEIRRFYVQNGKVIPNSQSTVAGVHGNAITQQYCEDQKKQWHSKDSFTDRGGLRKMGEALHEGMVLTFSLWDDAGGHMLWMDSGSAGPCAANSGVPSELHAKYPNAYLSFTKIRTGPINSTFHH